MMEFQEKSKPIYLQIIDRLCELVADGTFRPGGRIPSVREFAAEVQVNPNTVMRSYEYLSREGVISNRRGIGFFLNEDALDKVADLTRESFFNGEIQLIFRRLARLKVTPGQLSQYYSDYLNNSKQ